MGAGRAKGYFPSIAFSSKRPGAAQAFIECDLDTAKSLQDSAKITLDTTGREIHNQALLSMFSASCDARFIWIETCYLQTEEERSFSAKSATNAMAGGGEVR